MRWLILVIAAAAILLALFYHGSLGIISLGVDSSQTQKQAEPKRPVYKAISALGRLRPEGEVIRLSASPSVEGVRVERLFVKEGATVRSGQPVAVLDNHNRLKAALDVSRQQVKQAEAELAQVKAGAKAGSLEAQRATITRLEAELVVAKREYERYHHLFDKGAVTASQLDSKSVAVDSLAQQIKQAKATLDSLAEVREVDVQAAKAKIDAALAGVGQAEANLALSTVTASRDGQVLKIHARAGEIIGNSGILDLGQTNRMEAVAEVYETDIARVKVGLPATITSEGFSGTLHGTVDRIGLQIGKRDVFDTDPVASVDSRVVEVYIRLEPAYIRRVAGLCNLEVRVAIDPENHQLLRQLTGLTER